jgi:hypothetical protein
LCLPRDTSTSMAPLYFFHLQSALLTMFVLVIVKPTIDLDLARRARSLAGTSADKRARLYDCILNVGCDGEASRTEAGGRRRYCASGTAGHLDHLCTARSLDGSFQYCL